MNRIGKKKKGGAAETAKPGAKGESSAPKGAGQTETWKPSGGPQGSFSE